MLLHEILTDVNLLIKNSISDAIKVRWLNDVQRQIYRDFSFPDTSNAFQVIADTSFYALPSDCSRERITSVFVGDEEYTYVTVDDDVSGNAWTIIDEKLWLYPTPIQDKQGYLNYKPSPNDMRIDMQEEEPSFPKDFHELLVIGVAIRVSKSMQDANKTAELEEDFAVLRREAQRALRPSRNNKVKIRRNWE